LGPSNGRGQRFDLGGLRLEILDNARERCPLQLEPADRFHVVVEVDDVFRVRSRLRLDTPAPTNTSWVRGCFKFATPTESRWRSSNGSSVGTKKNETYYRRHLWCDLVSSTRSRTSDPIPWPLSSPSGLKRCPNRLSPAVRILASGMEPRPEPCIVKRLGARWGTHMRARVSEVS
jgi:hypothetical protein